MQCNKVDIFTNFQKLVMFVKCLSVLLHYVICYTEFLCCGQNVWWSDCNERAGQRYSSCCTHYSCGYWHHSSYNSTRKRYFILHISAFLPVLFTSMKILSKKTWVSIRVCLLKFSVVFVSAIFVLRMMSVGEERTNIWHRYRCLFTTS